ncbi:MAG: bifunctional serine/threonine-protein kinase/formylglycine-generating enzyme family protein [Polyangiaceae bacterium]
MVDPRDPFDLAGVTIDGKYRIASVVGDGGFGVVYRGVHKGFGELIAIKCLKLPTTLDEKQRADFLERLQDEGRLLHRLSKASSGIVQALDVGAFTSPDGRWIPYLILEWLEGDTLGQFLKQRADDKEGGLTVVEAVQLLGPAARALGVAHQQKIAHRDVKPANIFLTEVGGKRTTKVLDFGIAKVLLDQGTFTMALEATGTAPTAFTPRYGAPEQFNKQRGATGPWTDVFALALVLVECVCGRRALEGDDPTQLYIASADPAIRPTFRRRGIEVSDEVERVIEKALDVEPRNRFPDATAFWDAMEAAAGVEAPTISSGRDRLPSGPATIVDSSEPLMETGEFAAKNALNVDSDRSQFGPTVPHESLRAVPRAKEKGSPDRERSPDGDKKKPSVIVRGDNRADPDDPMSETPAGERRTSPTKASEGNDGEKKGSGLGIVWTILALGLFVGGGVFAYTTFFANSGAKKPGPASATPSASANGVTSGARPVPSPNPSVKPPPALSGSAMATGPSATPSASASAAPEVKDIPGMVKIPAGTFKMGVGDAETKITKDFWIDKYEVSYREYKECFAAHKCPKADLVLGVDPENGESISKLWSPKCNANRQIPDAPMNCVDAASAEAYCKWRKKRLPTEAEWELAARGTDNRLWPWGDQSPSCDLVCYGRQGTCPDVPLQTCNVGEYKGDHTPLAVFDLGGNVSEWTSDGFGNITGGTDPHVVANKTRVVRGASILTIDADDLRTTFRRELDAKYAHVDVGFRCATDGP